MIQLMNSLNAMLIVAVALVVAVILAVVAVLALRYTVLAAVETDLAQIAVLKAIGAPLRRIRRLYVAKYLALSALGAALGYVAGQPLATALEAPTTLYLGRPATTLWSGGCRSSRFWFWRSESSASPGWLCGASAASRPSRLCAAAPAPPCAHAGSAGD